MAEQREKRRDKGRASGCTQCATTAIVNYDGSNLCVRHYLMMQQASWIEFAKIAAMLNHTESRLAASSLFRVPNYITIPPPPSLGDTLTLNNIEVKESSVGIINTGTIKRIENLDASITLLMEGEKHELAKSLKCFTQLLLDSEIGHHTKEEIAQQTEYLSSQAQMEPAQRSMGMVRSLLKGIKETVGTASALAEAWSKLQPLFEAAFQIPPS